MHSVYAAANTTMDALIDNTEELNSLTESQKGEILFILSHVFLYKAQEFFWENVISNKKDALEFESFLFAKYEQGFGVNPRILLRDFADYVKDGNNELMYVGSRICDVINKRCASLQYKITLTVVHFIKALYSSCDAAWNLPQDKLIAMKTEFDNRSRSKSP